MSRHGIAHIATPHPCPHHPAPPIGQNTTSNKSNKTSTNAISSRRHKFRTLPRSRVMAPSRSKLVSTTTEAPPDVVGHRECNQIYYTDQRNNVRGRQGAQTTRSARSLVVVTNDNRSTPTSVATQTYRGSLVHSQYSNVFLYYIKHN